MRHLKKVNHLGRTSPHRKAMLSNMAASLILHKRITTTIAKAKSLRSYVEPLITKSKEDTTHSRRIVFSYLQDKNAVNELFREVSAKIMNRPGGYTRILKTGLRYGDNADMCIIELVDYNEGMLGTGTAKAKPAKRSRRSGGKKKAEAPAKEVTAEKKSEVTEANAAEEATAETKQAEPKAKKAKAKTENEGEESKEVTDKKAASKKATGNKE
jgi:large subunit ribosomal protein L17